MRGAVERKTKYLRASRAKRQYLCERCGATIAARELYFRDEPHPMARRRRGATVRHLCTRCVTGGPPSYFFKEKEKGFLQLLLPFAEALANLPIVLLQAAIIELGSKPDEGALVQAVTLPWFEIISCLEKDPGFLQRVPWRKMEEVIAGAYMREGWDEVTITPRSADGGRDIIAVRRNVCAIRIIDQVKAYSLGRRVTANDVRALLGVLSSDPNVSKGFVTTTADFAPHILEDSSIKPFVPFRLELRDGVRLKSWLLEVARRGKSTT
jgi:restriction system protein